MHTQSKVSRNPLRMALAALFIIPVLATTLAAAPMVLPSAVVSAAPDTTPDADVPDAPDPTQQFKDGCPKGQCIIDKYIDPVIKALIGLAGVALVISIIIGGIQYSAAGADPGKVAAAKGRIYKAVFVFLFFIFLYAFLQWLTPGGI